MMHGNDHGRGQMRRNCKHAAQRSAMYGALADRYLALLHAAVVAPRQLLCLHEEHGVYQGM